MVSHMQVSSQHPDGGASLRLSHQELVAFYNLLNAFLRSSSHQELEWADQSGQIEQVRTLAGLIGMPEPTFGL